MPQDVLWDSSGLANGELEEPLIISPYPGVGQAVTMVTHSRPGYDWRQGYASRKKVTDPWRGREHGGLRMGGGELALGWSGWGHDGHGVRLSGPLRAGIWRLCWNETPRVVEVAGLTEFSAVQPCLLLEWLLVGLQLRSPQPEPPGRKTREGMCSAMPQKC